MLFNDVPTHAVLFFCPDDDKWHAGLSIMHEFGKWKNISDFPYHSYEDAYKAYGNYISAMKPLSVPSGLEKALKMEF
jgi:hypothetical protein